MFRITTSVAKVSGATLRRVGFYAHRLRKEKLTKIIIASTASLALVLQLTTGVLPFSMSTAHATGTDNILSTPITSKESLLAVYDRNTDSAGHNDIQQIYTHFGVSRQDIVNATMGSYKTNDFGGTIKSIGRTNFPNTGRSAVAVTNSSTTVYTGPFLDNANAQAYVMPALIGKRTIDGQWFAITLYCGNIVYTVTPPPVPQPLYTCDMLTVTRIDRTTVKFDTKYTVKDAAFQSVTYVIRDANGTEIARTTTPTYAQTTVGSYTVEAIVSVQVNGTNVTATSAACKQPFTTVKEKTPAVTITKNVDGVKLKTVNVNQDFTYQLTVTNNGETDLTAVAVTDNAPAGVSFVKADVGSTTSTAWSTTIDSLKVGESKNFNITAHVNAFQAGNIVNTACVDAPQVPGTPDMCDTATVTVTPPTSPVTPTTPMELPHTGLGQTVGATLGVGSIIASIGYYAASRRNLLSAFLNR
jgi:uncharacterized repeat protein (TIGR01451 family)